MPSFVDVYSERFDKAQYPVESAVRAILRQRAENDPQWRPIKTVITDKGTEWWVQSFFPAAAEAAADTGDDSEEAGEIVPDAAASDIGARVVAVAAQLIADDVREACCWDWASRVYTDAGAKEDQVWPADYRYFFDTHPQRDFKQTQYYSDAKNRELMAELRPGDWLFTNNQNGIDPNGNHSVIFVDWESPGIARVAQLPKGRKRPPSVVRVNLHEKPLTHVSHAAQ